MVNLSSTTFEEANSMVSRKDDGVCMFKWSNHDDVLSFGQMSIDKNINSIDKYEAYGTVNALTSFREGVDTVLRLGDDYEKEVLFNRISSKLEEMKKEKKQFNMSKDTSAIGYLNGVRRDKAINLIESYINRW